MNELPPLPDMEDYCTPSLDKMAEANKYHTALVAYYESRLRMAVEALRDIKDQQLDGEVVRSMAREALAAIGPLPDAHKKEGV